MSLHSRSSLSTRDWDEEESLDDHDRARLADNMRGGSRVSRPAPRKSPAKFANAQAQLGDGLQSMRRLSRAVLRASSRVVNFGNIDIEDKQKIVDDDSAHEYIEIIDHQCTPLQGYSLGIFGPNSPIRIALRQVLIHPVTEPMILALIIVDVILLTIQAAANVDNDPRPLKFGDSWIDFALAGIFLIFTLEMIARIIVCGFIVNPPGVNKSLKPLQLDKQHNIREQKFHSVYQQKNVDSQSALLIPQRDSNPSSLPTLVHRKSPSVVSQSSLAAPKYKGLPFQELVHTQRSRLADRAYLRHTFNRLDFVAVISFWITTFLSALGYEAAYNIYIFRGLSCLRSFRLLGITTGTTTILQSLKMSAPLLLNVGYFVGFFFILFAIIGVQSFKGSFDRYCVWIDPAGKQNYTLNGQPCGGYLDSQFKEQPFIAAPGGPSREQPKGYICPVGQLCMDVGPNYNGTQNFNDVFSSAMLVIVIASQNSWTELMYHSMQSDFFATCIYFITCLIVLNYWLINLFVAVITQMFAKIREETKRSAFTASRVIPVIDESGGGWMLLDKGRKRGPSAFLKIYEKTKLFWRLLIAVDLAIMASKTSNDSIAKQNFLVMSELIFTLIFAGEIFLRFIAWLPDWRGFYHNKANVVDLNLAVITLIIQIPLIKNSGVYQWLTVFQVMRIYRVIIAIPRMRKILSKILGSVWGLVNTVVFIFLVTFLGALIAVQLVRGMIPATNTRQDVVDNDDVIAFNFSSIFNAFMGMYQILSSENWTVILYNSTAYANNLPQVVINALFFLSWFCLANFIFLNMFISVLQENFSIAEEVKRREQLNAFIEKSRPKNLTEKGISRWNPYKYFKPNPKAIEVSNLPPDLVLPMKKNMVREFLRDAGMDESESVETSKKKTQRPSSGFMMKLKQAFGMKPMKEEQYPLADLSSSKQDNKDIGNREQHIEALPGHDNILEDDPVNGLEEEKKQRRAEFLTEHPNYDRTLWFFSNGNPFRKICQKCFQPPHGERLFGTPPLPTLSFGVNAFFTACILGSVVVAAIVTPAYQKFYYREHGYVIFSWFAMLDILFCALFFVEFFMKVIADGFLFTPNAYLLSSWNVLDFFVLITLVVNVVATITNQGNISRSVRAFKALRAIRLMNISDSIKTTFYVILVKGFVRILDAAVVSISLIVPFAIWGQNLFSGLLYLCNDSGSNLVQCTGEFNSSPYNWNVLAPRVWSNYYVWSFDNFQSALLILFEIVSLEGWIDVMWSAMSITGLGQAPLPNASAINAIYFITYNLLGAVFVLTLFISIIIENYTVRAGQALWTTEQRQWIDLRKLLQQIRPSKRPKERPKGIIREWCFDRAVSKRGYWSRMMTMFMLLHIAVLMTEYEKISPSLDHFRDYAFLGLIVVFSIDIIVRLMGLGWQSFRQATWNLYDLVMVSGSAITTIPITVGTNVQAVIQLQKLFLVGIAFKLVQKSDRLNQLFKTAAASLPSIVNLFAVWFVLFVVYAITFTEIFGLTKYGQNGSDYVNFRSFSHSLILLIRMSTGEGWNAIMHDYTVEAPNCIDSGNYLNSDCGSTPWAYTLFMSWNVLSMYIFASMFIVIVIDNFSYVFQVGGSSSLVSRDEMRKFKKVWAQVDTNQSGYIERKDFAKFFGYLQGLFEVGIYPDEFRIPRLMEAAKVDTYNPETDLGTKKPMVYGDLDIRKLNKHLEKIDSKAIQQRRRLYNQLYQEALFSEEHGKGISFTNMLLMLAHYKLIDDDASLQLAELIARKIKMEKVRDFVNLDRVQGLLTTIYLRKKFLAYLEEKRMTAMQGDATIPMITVNNGMMLQVPGGDPRALRINTDVPTRSSNSSPGSGSTPPGSPKYPGAITPASPGSGSDREDMNMNHYGRMSSVDHQRLSSSASTRSSALTMKTNPQLHVGGFGGVASGGREELWGQINPEEEMDEETAARLLEEMNNSKWGAALRRAEADQTKI